ncbi:hypothetical protein [Colwellia sp. C1TZA3]|uniref:hypothetical protein n=1 Tax=Colwellia sp. C1TZA3 TaxID=2508879 RepID=UPI0011B97219|nr:hypothetical protein [Colwellia sp. C1TZA3]TWX73148.1 hypothetical protein ESZ39_05090 [Colwellia sp. C1TZA3]
MKKVMMLILTLALSSCYSEQPDSYSSCMFVAMKNQSDSKRIWAHEFCDEKFTGATTNTLNSSNKYKRAKGSPTSLPPTSNLNIKFDWWIEGEKLKVHIIDNKTNYTITSITFTMAESSCNSQQMIDRMPGDSNNPFKGMLGLDFYESSKGEKIIDTNWKCMKEYNFYGVPNEEYKFYQAHY